MKTIGIVPVAFPGRESRIRRHRDSCVNVQENQLGRDVGKPLELAVLMSVFDNDVLSLDVAELAKPLPKRVQAGASAVAETAASYPTRGTFFCCCAWAAAQRASSKAPRKNQEGFLPIGLVLKIC